MSFFVKSAVRRWSSADPSLFGTLLARSSSANAGRCLRLLTGKTRTGAERGAWSGVGGRSCCAPPASRGSQRTVFSVDQTSIASFLRGSLGERPCQGNCTEYSPRVQLCVLDLRIVERLDNPVSASPKHSPVRRRRCPGTYGKVVDRTVTTAYCRQRIVLPKM